MAEVQKFEIPFREDTIEAIRDVEGYDYVVPKRICDNLGVSWQGQHAKLISDPMWRIKIILMGTNDGPRETCVIPLNRVAAWLFTISPNKVAPELAEKVRLYREECADVLDAHFRGKEIKTDITLVSTVSNLVAVVSSLHDAVARMQADHLRIESLENRSGPAPKYVTLRKFAETYFPDRKFLPGEMKAWGVKMTNYCKVKQIDYRVNRKQNEYPEHIIGKNVIAMMGDAIKRDRSQQLVFDFSVNGSSKRRSLV